jgi:hypothetical protein
LNEERFAGELPDGSFHLDALVVPSASSRTTKARTRPRSTAVFGVVLVVETRRGARKNAEGGAQRSASFKSSRLHIQSPGDPDYAVWFPAGFLIWSI